MQLRSNKRLSTALVVEKPKKIPKTTTSNVSKQNEIQIANSWVLYAMREVMGMEHIRNQIVKTLYPNIKNAKYMRTFDGLQQYDEPPFDDKAEEILDYCDEIIDYGKYVVFTASNIQEDAEDHETHYQTYLVDNKNQRVLVINPAKDPESDDGFGIYKPQVTYEVIQPFFEMQEYDVEYVNMTNPAQISMDDVFCQSWSLYILLQVLNMKWRSSKSKDLVVSIPKKQESKYKLLLEFYKDILRKVPDISSELNLTYIDSIEQNYNDIKQSGINVEKILHMDAANLIFEMTTKDMM